MKKKFEFSLSTQNKLIITGLVVSTAIIMAVSYFAIDKIREKLYENYANSGQLLGRTIAIQSYELMKKSDVQSKKNLFRQHAKLVLEGNSDISFVTHKDANNKTIYSTTEEYPKREKDTKTTLTTPVLNEKD